MPDEKKSRRCHLKVATMEARAAVANTTQRKYTLKYYMLVTGFESVPGMKLGPEGGKNRRIVRRYDTLDLRVKKVAREATCPPSSKTSWCASTICGRLHFVANTSTAKVLVENTT